MNMLICFGLPIHATGAVITHGQLVAQCKALLCVMKDFLREKSRHCYVAYLPLAHMFEFTAELLFLGTGIRIAYASPLTLIDGSPGLQSNEPSDMSVIKPTVFIAVPLVLDRIRRGVTEQINNRPVAKAIFNCLITYKDYWRGKGYTTPIANFFLSRKARKTMGSNIEYFLVGGAPVCALTCVFTKLSLAIFALMQI